MTLGEFSVVTSASFSWTLFLHDCNGDGQPDSCEPCDIEPPEIQDSEIDLDIDSDNNEELNASLQRTSYEDQIEEDEPHDWTNPGKIILVNSNDSDGDGIPNFADGYNIFGNSGSDAGGRFTPMILEFKNPLSPGELTFSLNYSASDPDKVTRSGSGTSNDPYVYTPAVNSTTGELVGHLRVWSKDGNYSRNKAELKDGGDYIKPGVPYTLSELGQVSGTVVLYVEGINKSENPADNFISVSVSSNEDDVADPESDRIKTTLLKVDIEEVYEKDQIWNKAPNPRNPEYANVFEDPAEPLEEDELNNRLFVAIEPESSKIEIVVELKDRLDDGFAAKLLSGVKNQDGDILVNEFAAFYNPEDTSKGTSADLTFTPGGSGQDIVYEVVLGLDQNDDGVLSQSEVFDFGDSVVPFTVTAITSSDINGALTSGVIPWGSSIAFIGRYLRYFTGEDNGLDETTVAGTVNFPINGPDKRITMIAGSDYNQTNGDTNVVNFHASASSGYAEVLTNMFSEDGSRGLYQLVQRTWKRHALDIWEHFETTSDTEKIFTYILDSDDYGLNFYYATNGGFNAPRLMFGGAHASGGTVSLALYRDGDRIYANLISLNTTVVDVYDFDFTRARNVASRKAAIVQLSYDDGRDQGRIFHSSTDISFSFTDETDLGGFPQPLEYFNDNTYIENGNLIFIEDAGSEIASGAFENNIAE